MDRVKSLHPCGQCAFYDVSVWQPVHGTSVKLLTRGFKRRELEAGERVFRQGDDNHGVYCVSRGLIALRALQENGGTALLRLAYPGEVIGFRSFLKGATHQTEAVAVLPSRVCSVAQGDLSHLMQHNPEILARLAARCVDEIDHSHARIGAMATRSNKQRLTDLIYGLLERHGQKNGADWTMQLPLSRKDMADLIGVPPETLSRLLGRLQADGIFEISGREVRAAVGLQAGGRAYGH